MSDLVTSTVPVPWSQRLLRAFRLFLAEAAVVAGWFVVLGLIGAVVWELVTPLAEFTRTADNGEMGEEGLARQFSGTGWFLVIAAIGGFVGGVVLLLLRRRSPVLTVLLVALGGALATLVMLGVGLALGPSDPNDALATAQVGEKVPVQLRVDGAGVYFVWSIASLAGAVAALLFFETPEERAAREERLRLWAPING